MAVQQQDPHLSPRRIRVLRAQNLMCIEWQDDSVSELSLTWLRSNCPCASCRAARGESGAELDPLALSSGPMPSDRVAAVELVGGYAVRITWDDGHDTGIYAFSWLWDHRTSEDGTDAD